MELKSLRPAFEFLLRKPIDDRAFKNVLNFLPIPIDDPRLQKATLLRKIQSEIAKESLSENTLDLLEAIDDLKFSDNAPDSAAMKRAYCAVAVDCAVRSLDGTKNQESQYFKAMKRIWMGRVLNLEKSEKVGLISDELRVWKEGLQAALWDSRLWENLKTKNRENGALEKVNAYVTESWEGIGPWFIDLIVSKVVIVDDDTEMEVQQGMNQQPPATSPESHQHSCNDMHTGEATPQNKHVDVSQQASKTSTEVKSVNITESDSRAFAIGLGFHPSPYINKIRDELLRSCLELKAKAEDPLPAALKLADELAKSVRENIERETSEERLDSCRVHPAVGRSGENAPVAEAAVVDLGNEQTIRSRVSFPVASMDENTASSSTGTENINQEPPAEGKMGLDLSSCTHGEKTAAPRDMTNHDIHHCRNRNNLPKRSLMERNDTAHTYEWEDCFGTSEPKDCPDHEITSKRKNFACPPKKSESKECIRRRKRRWSRVEEDALTNGVQECGAGNWKQILNSYPEVFEGRIAVDLKDKWRNMTRHCNT